MRGRKPKPTVLKLIDGNPGKTKINKNEPIPVGDLKDAPDWFSDEQKAAWDYAIDHAPKGLLKKIDKSALMAWVIAEDLFRQAVLKVNQMNLIIKSPVKGDPMQNPYLPIVNKQAVNMLKAAAELGFTPSSRSRVTIDNIESNEENPFKQFAS